MRKNREVEFGRRVSDALTTQGNTIHQLADALGCSYEMARRYTHGVSIPRDPAKLQALASYLGRTVGWLLAEETNVASTSRHAATPISYITEPVKDDKLVLLEDDAMLSNIHGLRLLGSDDQVILAPKWPRTGDVVAVRNGAKTTLRKLYEENGKVFFRAGRDGHETFTGMIPVLGVVVEARARASGSH